MNVSITVERVVVVVVIGVVVVMVFFVSFTIIHSIGIISIL